MTKKKLNENTVRRFMKLADIGSYSKDFVDKLKEHSEEIAYKGEISERHPAEEGPLGPAEGGEFEGEAEEELADLDVDVEEEATGEVAEITDEDVETLRDAKDVLEKIIAGAPEGEPEGEPFDELGPEEEATAEEEPFEEELPGMKDVYENLIKKVSSKIAERVLGDSKKNPLKSIDVDTLAERVIARLKKEKK